jgi:hypothetical protein
MGFMNQGSRFSKIGAVHGPIPNAKKVPFSPKDRSEFPNFLKQYMKYSPIKKNTKTTNTTRD